MAEVPLVRGESSTLDQAAWTTRGVLSSEHPWVPGAGVPSLCVTCFLWRHSWSSGRQHALQQLVCIHVCQAARGATRLLVSIPTLPQPTLHPCLTALPRSRANLAPCLTSRDQNKLK